MKNVPENELFSAYLDGELTAEEQAQVDRLLAASPAARQLLEEIRALSGTLQSLPVHKLDEDLAPEVLRIAERRMLGEPAPHAEPGGPASASPPGEPPLWKTIVRRATAPRNLVWSCIAVAVALVIMLSGPQGLDQNRGPRSVAVAPRADDIERREAEPRSEPANASVAAAPQKGEADHRNASAELAAKEPGGENQRDKDHAGAAPAAPASAAGPPARGAISATPAEPEGAVADKMAEDAPDAAKRDRPHLKQKTAPPGALAAGQTAHGKNGAGFGAGAMRPEADSGALAKAGRATAVRRAGEALRRKAAADDTTVVVCDLTPAAVENGAFQQLLARQQIAWDEAPGLKELTDRTADLAREQWAVEKAARAGEGEGKGEGKGLHDAKQFEGRAPAGGLDVVMVEATDAQIKAVLAALHDEPQHFASVSVAPPQSAAAWGDRNRVAQGADRPGETKKADALPSVQGAGGAGRAPGGAEGGRGAMADGQAGRQHSLQGIAVRVPVQMADEVMQARKDAAQAAPSVELEEGPAPRPPKPAIANAPPGKPPAIAPVAKPEAASMTAGPADHAQGLGAGAETTAKKGGAPGPGDVALPGMPRGIRANGESKPAAWPRPLPEPAHYADQLDRHERQLAQEKARSQGKAEFKAPAEFRGEPPGEGRRSGMGAEMADAEADTVRYLFVLRMSPGGPVASSAVERVQAAKTHDTKPAASPSTASKAEIMEAKPVDASK